MENEGKLGQDTARIVSRAWSDPEFMGRLAAEPEAVLADAGIPVRDDLEIRVVEDGEKVRHFVLPAPPTDAAELSDEALQDVAAGSRAFWGSGWSFPPT